MQQLNALSKFPWILVSCICLLLSATSCADFINSDDTYNNSPSNPVCTDISQCPKKQICSRGYCTLEETVSTKIGLTFIPPHSTSYQPQRIEPFEINPKISLQIGLKASVLVRGDISYDGSSLPGPSGLLSVRINNDRTGFHTQQTRVDAGKFEIYLLPGKYTLSLIPDESSIPAFSWLPDELTSDTELKLTLPNPKSILTVQGNITFQPLTGTSGTEIPKDVPIEEARVMAISEKGLSSTSATTSEIGHFVLNVWPNSGAHDLHISPIHANSLMPTVVIRNAFTARDETILASQTLGAYPNAALHAQIRLHTADAQSNLNDDDSTNIDWTQTSIILRADMGHGLLKLTPQISKDGSLEFKTLEGKYTIEIIPPLDSRYARTSLAYDLSSSNSVIEIEIPLKKNVQGIVYDSEGNSVDNVKIKFSPKVSGDPQLRSSSEARTITVTTDDNGRFNTWLEHTGYQASIIPLANSGLPRTFTTFDTTDPDFDTSNLTITIPHPVIIHGSLYDENGRQPMANVSIQGYDLIDGQHRVIAEALSNAHGEFILVTPASLQHLPNLPTAANTEIPSSN